MNTRWMVRVVACAAALIVMACRPSDESDRASRAAATASGAVMVGPAATARVMNHLYQQRDYEKLAPMIVESARAQTIDLLRAVAEVLDADASLQRAAETAYCVPYSAMWRLDSMANNLGVFSAKMQIINQKFRSSDAHVTLQEADHVPLVHARFELHGDRWLYRPEENPASLPADLRALAASLREIERGVQQGDGYDAYVEAFFEKAIPRMLRVVATGPEQNAIAAGEPLE